MYTLIIAALASLGTATPPALYPRATNCPSPAGPFILQGNISLGNPDYCDINGSPYYSFDLTQEGKPKAVKFYLDSNGHLVDEDQKETKVAAQSTCSKAECRAIVPSALNLGGRSPLVCSIDATTCAFNCEVNGYTTNFRCTNTSAFPVPVWYIGDDVHIVHEHCETFQPFARFPA